MNILLIGSGGREHAIAWALQKSPNTDVLYVAPGNGGTAEIAENVDLDIADGEALLSFVHERNIGLVVIGPEAPLVDGVADLLRADGVPVFGPNADGAQLEGSKAYSKEFMMANDIPTAAYGRFDNEADALAYVREQGAPIVIKADGLAAGKGVVVAETVEDAEAAVRACFDGAFGDAGSTVVIEECMTGPECSLLCFVTAGQSFPMAPAQDHKRRPLMATWAQHRRRGRGTLAGAHRHRRGDGRHGGYHGEGGRRYGARALRQRLSRHPVWRLHADPGRPEDRGVQRALRRPRDPGRAAPFGKRPGGGHARRGRGTTRGCAAGSRSDDWAVSVVLASEGYPGSYEKGKVILGIEEAEELPGVTVFHAGTRRNYDGRNCSPTAVAC